MKASSLNAHEQIAELAHRIYEQEGKPQGQAREHWERAERALRLLKLSEPPIAPTSENTPA